MISILAYSVLTLLAFPAHTCAQTHIQCFPSLGLSRSPHLCPLPSLLIHTQTHPRTHKLGRASFSTYRNTQRERAAGHRVQGLLERALVRLAVVQHLTQRPMDPQCLVSVWGPTDGPSLAGLQSGAARTPVAAISAAMKQPVEP